jgi:hypothetical protein
MIHQAEAAGTYAMPHNEPADKRLPKEKAVIKKAAHEPGHEGAPDTNENDPTKGEQPQKLEQSGPLKPHVSVEGKEPPTLITKKEAQQYALPSLSRYPLDGYDQVIKAASYFEDNCKLMSPEHRREYCVNLVKRASQLGLGLSKVAYKYGGDGYASDEDFDIALTGRKNVITDNDHKSLLNKLAEQRGLLTPDLFAVALSEFDKVAGIDWMYDEHILDPYFSTFGKSASTHDTIAASKQDDTEDESFVIGNEYVTPAQLKRLVTVNSKNITDTFGEDFMKEYLKDAVGIFKSLPIDQKKILIRMATNDSPS